jgi:hypothetical protein
MDAQVLFYAHASGGSAYQCGQVADLTGLTWVELAQQSGFAFVCGEAVQQQATNNITGQIITGGIWELPEVFNDTSGRHCTDAEIEMVYMDAVFAQMATLVRRAPVSSRGTTCHLSKYLHECLHGLAHSGALRKRNGLRGYLLLRVAITVAPPAVSVRICLTTTRRAAARCCVCVTARTHARTNARTHACTPKHAQYIINTQQSNSRTHARARAQPELDLSRTFFHGCSEGSAFTQWQGVCRHVEAPSYVSALATHSTGLKVKGDGNILPPCPEDPQYTWGECPECMCVRACTCAWVGCQKLPLTTPPRSTGCDPSWFSCSLAGWLRIPPSLASLSWQM